MEDTWNKNFFDWCWNCFNMGQRIYISETWAQDNPEAAKFSKALIPGLRRTDQSKYNYFSQENGHYKMVIPEVEPNQYIENLIPGFIFLIKEHINHYINIVKWEFENNNLIFYFDLAD